MVRGRPGRRVRPLPRMARRSHLRNMQRREGLSPGSDAWRSRSTSPRMGGNMTTFGELCCEVCGVSGSVVTGRIREVVTYGPEPADNVQPNTQPKRNNDYA